MLALGQSHALRFHVEGLLHADVVALRGKARRDVALAGRQRVPKEYRVLADLLRELEGFHDFIKIAANQRVYGHEKRQLRHRPALNPEPRIDDAEVPIGACSMRVENNVAFWRILTAVVPAP